MNSLPITSYAAVTNTEGTGSNATANVPGNISFSVPTETILGVQNSIGVDGGSAFISPSNWNTVNTGDYPISITYIYASDGQDNIKKSNLLLVSQKILTAANGKTQGQPVWSVNSGYSNKTYSEAGGQLVLPSKDSITWDWHGGISLANMSNQFRLDLSNGLAELGKVTFVYRAIVPLTGKAEIGEFGDDLSCSFTDTNIASSPYENWYIVNRDGTETQIGNPGDNSIKNSGDLAGKTIICKISDPSYWAAGTITSDPYYVPDKFAIYSEDDHSLIFYDRGGEPTVGDTFNGRKVTAIYSGLTMEKLSFDSKDNQPWANERNEIHTVSFADEYVPTGTGHWFEGCENLKSIDLHNLSFGKATFATNMFDGCSSLTDINAEILDVSSLLNANNMFRGCTSLKSLDIGNWNVSKLWNTGSMFQNCTSLASLDLSKWDTSNFTVAYSMFQNCTSLDTVGDTTNWNLSSLSNPTYMFTGCQSLKHLNTQNWSMKSANDLQFIFDDCFDLGNIDVSNWDTSHVTDISWLFNKCYQMTSIDVSNWDVSNVKNMQGAFANTTNLAAIDVSNWNVSKVTDFSYMFNRASSLKSIAVDTWDVSKSTTFELTFAGCTDLTNLNVSNWNVTNCKSMNYTFGECPNIETIDVSKWNVKNSEIFYRMFFLDTSLKSLDLSKWVNSVSTNWIDFTHGCENIRELDLSGIDNTNAGELCGGVFVDMFRLEKITFGSHYQFTTRDAWPASPDPTYIDGADWNWYAASDGTGYALQKIPANKADTYYATKNNPNIPKAFAIYSDDDGSLNFYKRTTVPSVNSTFNGKTVTSVYTGIESLNTYPEAAPWIQDHETDIKTSTFVDDNIKPKNLYRWFYNATSMTQCDVSKLDTSEATTLNNMFTSCRSLTSIDVSHFNTSKVTDMNGVFDGCMKITSVGDLSNWDTSNVTDMTCMFMQCLHLISIGNLSNWDTSNVTDMSYMFGICSSIESLDGLSTWDVSNVTNMNTMLSNCRKLSSLDISNWNVSKVTNMYRMLTNDNFALDCSNWNAINVTNHTEFNDNSPNIIAPSCWN